MYDSFGIWHAEVFGGVDYEYDGKPGKLFKCKRANL